MLRVIVVIALALVDESFNSVLNGFNVGVGVSFPFFPFFGVCSSK
jgi:hypothetical protein